MKATKASSPIIFIALAMVSASVSAAEWVPIGSSGGEPFFIDRSSIRKHGDALQVWMLKNLSASNSIGAQSQITAYLLNCDAWEIAMRTGVDYSGLDGKGEVRYTFNLSSDQITYAPAIPGTVNDAVLTAGCGTQR